MVKTGARASALALLLERIGRPLTSSRRPAPRIGPRPRRWPLAGGGAPWPEQGRSGRAQDPSRGPNRV